MNHRVTKNKRLTHTSSSCQWKLRTTQHGITPAPDSATDLGFGRVRIGESTTGKRDRNEEVSIYEFKLCFTTIIIIIIHYRSIDFFIFFFSCYNNFIWAHSDSWIDSWDFNYANNKLSALYVRHVSSFPINKILSTTVEIKYARLINNV